MEGADVDENNPGPARRPPGFQGHPMEASKFIAKVGSNRRALEDIRNLVGAPPNPWTTSKNVLKHGGVTITSHRPVTRSFAATLKSRTCSQEANMGNDKPNKTIYPPLCRTGLDAATAIDVDDYKPANDLPMVEEMEAEMDSELEEVEMEDMETIPIPDIDSPDANNPLAVVEYVDDIYAFYRETEVSSCVCPIYMAKQIDINEKMRAILIDWLIEVHYKFDLMDETLYLTVSIIDRFLARQNVMRKKLQLVGVTAMLLACKYEEVSVPVVEDLIIISDRAYTRSEILEMEKLIINTLQFNMSAPTPYVFMRRFLKAAESDKQLERLSFFIIELCLVEYEMLKFRPSLLAAAAIYTAQCCIRGFKDWTRTCEVHTSYSEYQLLECSRMMVNFHKNAGVGKLTGVHRKYSTYRFGYAARFGPASFLL